jgi:ubiquinone/menaquinone biosynthesis C-methylase UbiE
MINVEESVRTRYSQGAQQRQEALCCPVDYDRQLLEMLPAEIIERDYGCGDPSRYVRNGDVVLDLGSGGGKICYMAAQLTGTAGRVIGVDMNDDMLALARRHQSAMAARLGNDRVRFHKGYIQDLALDVEALDAWLAANPVHNAAGYEAMRQWQRQQRRVAPMITDASVDLVISNCVLNLVADSDKQSLVTEIFRVLKPGGRIAIADIVSDRPATDAMKQDPELWSGCISGAFTETGMLDSFSAAGFQAVIFDKWDAQPWRVVDGIEFRSVTLTAIRPAAAMSNTGNRELMYRGPFSAVTDDTGRNWPRGQRISVPADDHETLVTAYGNSFIDLANATTSKTGKPVPVACCTPELNRGGCC